MSDGRWEFNWLEPPVCSHFTLFLLTAVACTNGCYLCKNLDSQYSCTIAIVFKNVCPDFGCTQRTRSENIWAGSNKRWVTNHTAISLPRFGHNGVYIHSGKRFLRVRRQRKSFGPLAQRKEPSFAHSRALCNRSVVVQSVHACVSGASKRDSGLSCWGFYSFKTRQTLSCVPKCATPVSSEASPPPRPQQAVGKWRPRLYRKSWIEVEGHWTKAKTNFSSWAFGFASCALTSDRIHCSPYHGFSWKIRKKFQTITASHFHKERAKTPAFQFAHKVLYQWAWAPNVPTQNQPPKPAHPPPKLFEVDLNLLASQGPRLGASLTYDLDRQEGLPRSGQNSHGRGDQRSAAILFDNVFVQATILHIWNTGNTWFLKRRNIERLKLHCLLSVFLLFQSFRLLARSFPFLCLFLHLKFTNQHLFLFVPHHKTVKLLVYLFLRTSFVFPLTQFEQLSERKMQRCVHGCVDLNVERLEN